MAVGKQGPGDVTVTLEDAPGGTARNIHGAILNGIEASIMAEMVESHGLGTNWKERTPTGIMDSDQITLEGYFDTTPTTGSHAVFGTVDSNPNSAGRQMVFTPGDSKTWTRSWRLSKYTVISQTSDLTRFRAVLDATGSAAWA